MDIQDSSSPRPKTDCYFYYYSSCDKGASCPFRHEPNALRTEVVCKHWLKGLCKVPHCTFRHMELNKRRDKIACYFEKQAGGCKKLHCPFYHNSQLDDSSDGPDLILPVKPTSAHKLRTAKFCNDYIKNHGQVDDKDRNKLAKVSLKGRRKDNLDQRYFNASPKIDTVFSDDLQGDLIKDEICYASVETGCCVDEEIGCRRLHAYFHFHWQVKEQGKGWLNLIMEQVLDLEKGFCDVEKESIILSPLDPSSLTKSSRGLLRTMKGRHQWKADFNTMTLKLSDGNDQLDLRRLTTEVTKNEIPPPCLHTWYFSDINSKWIAYGNADSSGKENLKCDHDSDAIEMKYNKDHTALIRLSNEKFDYNLDPVNMVQTNLKTGVIRKVRRRPRPHLKEEAKPVAENNITINDLPGYWKPMDQGVQSLLVTIPNSSDEYNQISTHFKQKGGNYNILKVQRVQNPYVWRAFQNKIKEVEALYKDPGSVNIQQLFHGTRPGIVADIVKQNFDWRLHGSSSGQAYGRGTYFAASANTSYSYTQPDNSNQRFMFVAKVLVGKVSLGNSTMARPPTNPTTKMPYESTVDNMTNPGIIVKYDKQEYYPEYVLTIL